MTGCSKKHFLLAVSHHCGCQFLAWSCALSSSCHPIFQVRGTASRSCLIVCASPNADKTEQLLPAAWQGGFDHSHKIGVKMELKASSLPLCCLHQGCGCLIFDVVPLAAGFDHQMLPFSRCSQCIPQTGTGSRWLGMLTLLHGSAAEGLGSGWCKRISFWATQIVS